MMIHPDLDGWKASADKFNKVGEACKAAGIGFAYHNHSQEYANMEGEVVMDMLLQRTEPDLVSFEMDLFWTTVAGVKPQDYFERYPGRFKMLHIKDMDVPMKTPNTDWQVFTNAEEAMKFMGKQTVIGGGFIDFKTIIADSQNDGLEHLFIESDFPPEPVPFAKKSFENLNGMINS
jgi:sugar phosphate isomerase/epimerase